MRELSLFTGAGGAYYVGYVFGVIAGALGMYAAIYFPKWLEKKLNGGRAMQVTEEQINELYHAINNMMGYLGAHGEISTRNTATDRVMDALHKIDGGVYEESVKVRIKDFKKTKIQDRELSDNDYLAPVTYIPNHANGKAGHPDCEQGVIVSYSRNSVKVLYCKSRTVQSTNPNNLVWG